MATSSVQIVTLLLFNCLLPVAGHGFVHWVVAGGQTYPGWNPNLDPYADPVPSRIVRKIPNDGPILNVDDPNIACNLGGEFGQNLTATAAAGQPVVFQWQTWLADHLGPVSTYMTSCNGDCSAFDVNGAKWFKIDADGYDSGVWASTKLMNNNASWTSTIPAELAPGNYLLRHEIVALHSIGAPQFYPSCSQVQVTSSGTATPAASDLVSIPGLYDGITWPDIWADNFTSYAIAGPPVVSFGSTSGGSGGSSAATSTAAPAASVSPTSTPSASTTSASRALAPSASIAAGGRCKPSLMRPGIKAHTLRRRSRKH